MIFASPPPETFGEAWSYFLLSCLLVTVGGRCYQLLVGRARDSAKHPTIRQPPQQRVIQAKMPTAPRLRNPGMKSYPFYLQFESLYGWVWTSFHVFVSCLDLLSCMLSILVLCSFFFWLFIPKLSTNKNILYFITLCPLHWKYNFLKYTFDWLICSIFCQIVKSYWRT